MKRKQFLASALAAFPALAFSQVNIDEQDSIEPFIVRAGGSRTGKLLLYKGIHPNNIIVSKKDTGNAISIFCYTGFAKIGPSVHLHFNQDEIFYVVEGQYRFLVGDKTEELAAGDLIFLPRNVAHSWIQLTEKGQMLYAVQPAGTMEEFFLEMDEMSKPPTEEDAKAIHLKHGMKLIGKPLTL